MGFKPPDDVGSVSGLRWVLVAIPDDPAYRTAALGVYTDLANVWNWGLESIDPDADTIRQQWLAAIDETIEALELGFPTTLLGYVDGLETLLRELKSVQGCCPDNVTYLPGPSVDNPNGYEYEAGPYPSTWGEATTISDLADFQDVVCGAAHTYVDYLAATSISLDSLIENKLLTIAALATILGALATGGLSLLVEAALAGAIFTAIVGAWSTDLFSDASAAIEAARADIICALLSGDAANVESVIQAEVSSSAWLLWYKWIDYQSAINVMLTGELNGDYLTERLGEDCYCAPATNWGDVANAEWRDGTLAETTSSPYTTASAIDDNSIDYDLTITAAASNWAPIVTAYPPTVGAGETIIGVAWRLSQGYTDGGINDPGSHLIRFEGQIMAAEWTGLYYSNDDAAYKTAIDVNNTFDYELAQTQAQIEADRPLDFYCRRGTGQPEGSGEATVIDIQWLVDLG